MRSFVISDFRREVYERTALFWIITQRIVVIPSRRFGTTYGPIFKGQESKKDPVCKGQEPKKDPKRILDPSRLDR